MSMPLFDLPGVEPPDAPSTEPKAPPTSAPQREVTFLHTADWQLGMTRHFLPGDAQATYDAAREGAVVEIGRLAASTGAEFVVVCGDVFDDPRVSSRIIRRTLDALGAYPVPVYLLPGNHDPLDTTSVYRSTTFRSACPANVHVLDRAGAVRVRDGVTLIAAPWTSKRPESDLIADQLARLAPSDDLRIVVGHGGVDTFSPGSGPAIVAASRLREAVDTGLVDYIALGDRHSATEVGDSQRIWYSGAPEVTDFDHVESDSGQVLQVTLRRGAPRQDATSRGPSGVDAGSRSVDVPGWSSGVETGSHSVDVIPHRVGRWTFTTIRHDVTGPADLECLRARLAALPDKPRTVVKLAVVGTLGLADEATFQELVDEFTDHFAALWFWERHHDLRVVADPSDVAGLGLQGYAAQAADELVQRAGADDPEDAAAAHSALSLLFRLTGGDARGDRS
ncbi:metallophosphoesterase family protein [Gordonia iterans]|nr:metallophosphoesterase [Gordonia iterans]